jgi:hypothetical protein
MPLPYRVVIRIRAAWARIKGTLNFFTKSEWLNVFLTTVIAGTGVVGIILVIRSGGDTQKMITAAQQQACAANKNAAAAQSFALSAQGINQGIGDAVSKLNLQATATTNLAAAARKQVAAAELANKNAALALEAQTRPWLGIEGQKATSISTRLLTGGDGIQIDFQIDLHNYGQSPAIDVVLSIPQETFGGRFGIPPRSLSTKICEEANEDAKTNNSNREPEIVVWPGKGEHIPIVVHTKQTVGTWAIGCFSYKGASGSMYDTYFVYRISLSTGDPLGEDHTLRVTGVDLISVQPGAMGTK